MRAAEITGDERVAAPVVAPPAVADVARRARLHTAGVFLFAAAFFVALMSGHIYARDEETLYQMTDGVARHGEPLVSPEVWGIVESPAPSKHGLRPTSYAPGQAVLAVPFYWIGQVVGAAGAPDAAPYLERFITLAFNAFVTAATAALLFRFALALGYRRSAGAALVVCFGAGTFALIQARTFFAEPLTAALVLLAFLLMRQAVTETLTERARWVRLAGSGFAVAAALFVKVHAALFLPVLALYLTLATFPTVRDARDARRWRALILRGAAWVSGIAGPVAALLLYNRWLYGGAFTTGYGSDAGNLFTTPLGTGLYGLLWSSGKGVIWFAPPLLFAAIGLPRFARRHPPEGAAILCAALVNLLFYARLEFWHGDGSWGPRYLTIVLPWLLLPALPVFDWLLAPGWGTLRTAARAGAAAVLLAGMLVQSLAIAVSFDIPILTSTTEQARFFTPAQSPIAISWRTARSRFAAWWGEGHPAANTFLLDRGLYPPEDDPKLHFPRWTDGRAVVVLHPQAGAALHIKLTYFDHRPAAMRAIPTPLAVTLGDTTLAPVDRLPIAPANEGFILAFDVPAAALRAASPQLAIASPTWNPARAGASDRDENLGIFINNLEVWADGVPMAARERAPASPVPPTPRHVWLWANYPNFPHLLDWWPTLLRDAQLPGNLAVDVSLGMIGCLVLLLGAGVACLRRAAAIIQDG